MIDGCFFLKKKTFCIILFLYPCNTCAQFAYMKCFVCSTSSVSNMYNIPRCFTIYSQLYDA